MNAQRRLPPGWDRARLGDIAEVRLGKMLSPKARARGLVQRPYLRNENVRWGSIDLADVKAMGFKVTELARYGVEPGDLLACEGGEPGRCAIFRGPPGTFMYQKALHRVRVRQAGVLPTLLQHWLRHLADSGALVSKIAQTTIKHLPLERFRMIEVPVPPTAEQSRIVEATESHLSRLDSATLALEAVQKKLKAHRASVLRAAVEGRLVPTEASLARTENREYEPADALLKRILLERRRRWERSELARLTAVGKAPKDDRWKARYNEPKPPRTSELRELPEGWCWSTVDQLAEVKGGVTKGQKRRPGQPLVEVPYLRVANVQRGYLDLKEVKTITVSVAERDELQLLPGDVLFNEGGDRDKLGRGWIWEGQIAVCIHQNHVFRARIVSSDVRPRFLSWYGNSTGQEYFFGHGKQTTNLASINMTKLKALPVPLPPLAEQDRMAEEVERLLSIANEVASETGHALYRCLRLRQSTLKWAFEGKLVDQDPQDEPAEALLARIRAATATVALPRKARRARSAA